MMREPRPGCRKGRDSVPCPAGHQSTAESSPPTIQGSAEYSRVNRHAQGIGGRRTRFDERTPIQLWKGKCVLVPTSSLPFGGSMKVYWTVGRKGLSSWSEVVRAPWISR
jgi:hypothetical protein